MIGFGVEYRIADFSFRRLPVSSIHHATGSADNLTQNSDHDALRVAVLRAHRYGEFRAIIPSMRTYPVTNAVEEKEEFMLVQNPKSRVSQLP